MPDYIEGFSGFAVPDIDAAATFYRDVLGLVVKEERGMLTLALPGGGHVLAYPKPDHAPAAFTILNLVVPDLPAAIDDLVGRGAEFLRYDGFHHDERGIVHGGGRGPDIAWTTDPAGNVIAVMEGSQEPEGAA
ncbi:VOC family protein [Agrococcus jejuensis]|uniref:VOC family protein n=1 Tax=Agrococcus jejuensis TaxID=399736 RepID=UPI0011A806DE|nr:VOC family protein [Agrococcus jejuensis]